MTELERIFFCHTQTPFFFFLTSGPSSQLAVISPKRESEIIFQERKWQKING
jgi:hypothetical protein